MFYAFPQAKCKYLDMYNSENLKLNYTVLEDKFSLKYSPPKKVLKIGDEKWKKQNRAEKSSDCIYRYTRMCINAWIILTKHKSACGLIRKIVEEKHSYLEGMSFSHDMKNLSSQVIREKRDPSLFRTLGKTGNMQ